MVIFLISRAAWSNAGGYPIALYRLRGIDAYQFYVFLPNKKIARPVVKASDLKIGSAARFEFEFSKGKTADYYLPQKDDMDAWFVNPYGMPSAEYNWDDTRPIRVFGTEPDAVNGKGDRIPKAKIDPMLVHSAYKNDILERRHKLNVKPTIIGNRFMVILIAITLILTFASLYYAYYFGINANCALHSKACI